MPRGEAQDPQPDDHHSFSPRAAGSSNLAGRFLDLTASVTAIPGLLREGRSKLSPDALDEILGIAATARVLLQEVESTIIDPAEAPGLVELINAGDTLMSYVDAIEGLIEVLKNLDRELQGIPVDPVYAGTSVRDRLEARRQQLQAVIQSADALSRLWRSTARGLSR